MTERRAATMLLTLIASASLVSAATAQGVPDAGGRVSGGVGGSFGDGGATVATTAAAGLRVTRHLGLDLEILYVPDLDLSPDGFGRLPLQPAIPFILPADREARLLAFLTKLVVEFPVADGKLWPYLTGGGGIARLTERIRYRQLDRLALPGIGQGRPLIFPPPDIERAETDLALTIGGGLDVRVWRDFAVGVDVRYVRLLGPSADLDVAQVTGRTSYRF